MDSVGLGASLSIYCLCCTDQSCEGRGSQDSYYLLLDPYPCRGICRPWSSAAGCGPARLVAVSCSQRSALVGGGGNLPDDEIDGIALVPVEQGVGRS